MKSFEFLNENSPRTLFHGTLKSNLPSIMDNGLEPRVGNFTKHFYDDDPDLEEIVVMSSRSQINKGLNSIMYYLKQQGIKPTPENVIRYGVMVVVKDERKEFTHKGSYYFDRGEHPRQAEEDDFYSRNAVLPTYIIQNNKLRDLLRREGFDDWMGAKHPKLKEVKYNPSVDDIQNVPLDDTQRSDKLFIRQKKREPLRGPHEGRYLTLMLKGMKPIARIFKQDLPLFQPYIKKGIMSVAGTINDDLLIAMKGEEWRAKKLMQVWPKLRDAVMNQTDNGNLEAKIHAQIGLLLGYPKDAINAFIAPERDLVRKPLNEIEQQWEGSWILPDGEIKYVDHETNYHHVDIAFNEFQEFLDYGDFETEEEALEDEFFRGHVEEAAFDEGWIRTMIRDNQFAAQFYSNVSKKAISILAKMILSNKDLDNFTFEGSLTGAFKTAREALSALKRYEVSKSLNASVGGFKNG